MRLGPAYPKPMRDAARAEEKELETAKARVRELNGQVLMLGAAVGWIEIHLRGYPAELKGVQKAHALAKEALDKFNASEKESDAGG